MDCLIDNSAPAIYFKISEFRVILKLVNDQITSVSQAHFKPQLWFTGAKSI